MRMGNHKFGLDYLIVRHSQTKPIGNIWLKSRIAVLLLLIVIMSWGCASEIPEVFSGCPAYAASAAPVPQSWAMLVWESDSGVEGGADPYVESFRQKDVFNATFTKQGVAAIQLLVKNIERQKIKVQRADIHLKYPDGEKVFPALKSKVLKKVKPKHRECMRASVPQDAKARWKDYREKELRDTTLQKEQSVHGFVYFIPPEGVDALGEATLILPVIDMEKAERITLQLKLSGSPIQN